MTFHYKAIPSPVGKLTLIASERGLSAVLWENDNPARVLAKADVHSNDHPILRETEKQLGEYFAGNRREFSLQLDMLGTPFQQQVWQALCAIPFGETRSYGDLAKQISNPLSVRAVGAANGRNPLSIVVPCHRVVGSNGKLTGFAGGLAAKSHLLSLERGEADLFSRRSSAA